MRVQRLILLTIGFVILAAISAASIALNTKTRSDAAAVAHAFEISTKLLNLRLPLRGAEGAQYGYLLTGDHRLLDDYRRNPHGDREQLLLACAQHTAGHQKYGDTLEPYRRYLEALGLTER